MPTDALSDPGLLQEADELFERDALGWLEEYTRIECLSPAFDEHWSENGHIRRAAALLADWARQRPLAEGLRPGATVEVLETGGLTPVVLVDVPATPARRGGGEGRPTLLYGHLDKQPPLGEWREGLGPYLPVREGDRLYGRGIADDGYSIFAALGAIEIAERTGVGHGRCLVVVEASEESGSPHLPAYLGELRDRLGEAGPSLVVCLDSGCLTYDRLWATTSLRGLVGATVRVDVLTEGVHSGGAGGVVPDSFRLLRRLLSRVEDERTGELLLEAFHVEIPRNRRAEAEDLAELLGDDALGHFPAVAGLRLGGETLGERILRRTWRPSVAYVGTDGLPSVRDGGNVLRPYTAMHLAIRLPPSADAKAAAEQLRERLLAEPPEGARVGVEVTGERGFDAPPTEGWLAQATDDASLAFFGQPSAKMGEGGTIPFLSMLLESYPEAQFLVTGLLGPDSNAHGVNEMMHIPTVKRLTASVAHVLSQVP